MSNDVSEWLEKLGLGQYREAFAENHIDERILPDLTNTDLKELGVTSVGHRKTLLKAILALRSGTLPECSSGTESESIPLASSLASSDAERRQLTVMFCDMAGSTELSQQLDPEDLREINRAYQDACKTAIEHFDGYVARYMGDGVLAYFGYPQAHEDDAERAVRAGLAVAEAMHGLSAVTGRSKGVEVAVRIGIATGPVVVGDQIGEGASRESAVVGETPNLAARLQGLAERNSIFRYYCSPHHNDSALHPVIRQLERAAGIFRNDTAGAKLEKVENLLRQGGGSAAEVVSLLAALLSIPADHRCPPLKLTPQAQKIRTFGALTEQVERHAEIGPVLMVLEDTHWLDPTTTELFGQIIDRLYGLRALLLISHRPEFNPPWTRFAAQLTSLTLNRLGRSQGWVLVERLTGDKTLPAEVLEQILLKTDGIPLFVEELTKTIMESGLLEDAGDHYVLARPLPAQIIPATLHDSLMYRLDRQISVKEVAQVGSVIGRAFSFELLASVTSLAGDALESALTHLVDSELVHRRGNPPEAIYTFKHALVQDAAYQSLLKSKKRKLHARIAEVLQERFPGTIDTEPELLARHYTAADMAEEAIPNWLIAGRRAIAGSSLPEAVSHLSKALELTAHIENELNRAKRELEVRTALGAATMALYGWPAPELREVVKPACALIERGYGDSDAFVNFWNLWVHHGCRAEHREGLAVVDRMLKHASEQDDPVMTLISSFSAAMANFWVGNYDLALAHEGTALEVYEFERDKDLVRSYNHDPRCTLLSWASHRVWALGFPDRARILSDEAVAHARRVGHPFNVCWTLGNSSSTYGYCGDHATACARIEELRRISREQELSFMEEYMAPVSISTSAVMRVNTKLHTTMVFAPRKSGTRSAADSGAPS